MVDAEPDTGGSCGERTGHGHSVKIAGFVPGGWLQHYVVLGVVDHGEGLAAEPFTRNQRAPSRAQVATDHRADSSDTRRAWEESSEPQSGLASTTLRQAAIDAINIGVSSAGGGGHESTGGEGAGGEQGNHVQ